MTITEKINGREFRLQEVLLVEDNGYLIETFNKGLDLSFLKEGKKGPLYRENKGTIPHTRE